ncbi:hypothetical protein SAPIO_CDS8804 [Scedosporium apiospermum]|uniref:Methyltransferase domain-containing protein n=1 Tax=Pseudallescheria apiosperma TaxID=563466 RepID=A0A084FXQ0_PSEDA|nr:uncharacterized protein SAPIO_CDS8804 [Scedosporium apiospermum]KEZ39862.1 hypothetical protein SAPIO_CDS8804 [Scedosporium apiospermum]
MGDSAVTAQGSTSPKSAKSPKSASSPIEPGAATAGQALVADENPDAHFEGDGDSTYDTEGGSDTTSLRSSIMKYRTENGRTYHAYKDGSYVLPNDDVENDRLDVQHNIFLLTFGGLHVASFEKEPQRVLDVGCGTGIWSIDFADEHPESHVTGIDLSPIQPPFVPPNVNFYVDDLEDDWNFSSPFDFIFARFCTGSIVNWPKFFKQSFDNLNSGGIIELQDIIFPTFCDDDTLPPDGPLKRWSDLLLECFESVGRGITSAYLYPEQLAEAGFVDVNVVREKWPTNRWPKDKRYKQIGIWNTDNMINALPSLSLALFTRPKEEGGLGWSLPELEVLLAGVRKDIRDPSIHGYWKIHAVTARKP